MSQLAINNLRNLWGDLVFAKVSRVIARQPEDVLYIHVYEYTPTSNGTLYKTNNYRPIKSNLLKDIPESERKFADVAWRRYYGFATNERHPEGIYFSSSRYADIDFDIDFNLDLCMCGNHHHGWAHKPYIDQWICGIVEDDPKGRGKRFVNWFYVDKQTRALIEMVQSGKCNLSEDNLALTLLGGACGYPDTLWGIARLVFFDKVQVFFDEFTGKHHTHPCFDLLYKTIQPEGYKLKVDWKGMYLPTSNIVAWVHSLSTLLEPKWWEEFETLCKQSEVSTHHHDGFSVFCPACAAQEYEDSFL